MGSQDRRRYNWNYNNISNADVLSFSYFNQDPYFKHRFVEEFITKQLLNEIIPDLLIETLSDIKHKTESKVDHKKYRLPSDQYVQQATGLDHPPDIIPFDPNTLLSENLVKDVAFTEQHPVDPALIYHSPINPLDRMDDEELPGLGSHRVQNYNPDNYFKPSKDEETTSRLFLGYQPPVNKENNGPKAVAVEPAPQEDMGSTTSLHSQRDFYMPDIGYAVLNSVVDDLIESMLVGEIVPNVVEKSIKEVLNEPKNEHLSGQTPANPDLAYYSNLYQNKSETLDNAREFLKKIDQKREKIENDRFKTRVFDPRFVDDRQHTYTRRTLPFFKLPGIDSQVQIRKF